MNEVQQFYLKTYGIIDTIEHYLKNTRLGYVYWKYWHSSMFHGTSLASLLSYDICKEVCEGKLDAAWRNNDYVQYWE
eukprot:6107668-Ditylum_brightwellii.AAC.1